MSKKNQTRANDPISPADFAARAGQAGYQTHGLTKLELFTAHALAPIVAYAQRIDGSGKAETIAAAAVNLAEKTIAALNAATAAADQQQTPSEKTNIAPIPTTAAAADLQGFSKKIADPSTELDPSQLAAYVKAAHDSDLVAELIERGYSVGVDAPSDPENRSADGKVGGLGHRGSGEALHPLSALLKAGLSKCLELAQWGEIPAKTDPNPFREAKPREDHQLTMGELAARYHKKNPVMRGSLIRGDRQATKSDYDWQAGGVSASELLQAETDGRQKSAAVIDIEAERGPLFLVWNADFKKWDAPLSYEPRGLVYDRSKARRFTGDDATNYCKSFNVPGREKHLFPVNEIYAENFQAVQEAN